MSRRGLLKPFLPILACLLILQLAENVPSVSAEGHCIWYGICDVRKYNNKYTYCSYNGPPLPIENTGNWVLDKYCHDIAKSGKACCNHEQLIRMSVSLEIIESILKRCPSCMDNFLKHICGMCGVNQSEYLNPEITPFNATHYQVKSLKYHLSKEYMQATFDSCLQVRVPSTDGVALDLMCGEYGSANCTPQRWFQFMGDVTVPFVPFQINYITDPDPTKGLTPYNPPTRPCNVGPRGQPGCSCLDCSKSCPAPSPRQSSSKPIGAIKV